MTHPDSDVLAEFRAGLITGRGAARISAHLSACERCTGLSDQLAEISALLAAVPAPVMPDAVAQRLESVLAAEAVQRVSSERAVGDGVPDRAAGSPPRRRWDFRLVALRVLAPAAAVVLLAAGGYGLTRIGASSTSSQAASSGVASAASSVPRTSATSLFHRKLILGLASARSCMIFEARSVSRRWITVTDLPNLVRNVASSMAESPPPTTAMS